MNHRLRALAARSTLLAALLLQPESVDARSRALPGDGLIVVKNVAARMRDGVVLRADVYRPSVEGRFPALLQRTPYSKNDPDDLESFRRIAGRGFVVIVQDTRGRYTSDGVARPHDEAQDGYDTVEWAATLPYVNG